jgi:hypothetical protein
MLLILLAANGNRDFLEQRAQQLLPVADGERGCTLGRWRSLPRASRLWRSCAERTGLTLFASSEFLLRLFEFEQMHPAMMTKAVSYSIYLRQVAR